MLSKYQRFARILSDITQVIHAENNVDEILRSILLHIQGFFSAKGCTLRILDPSHQKLNLKQAVGLSRQYLEKGPVVASDGLSEIFLNEPIVIQDIENDQRIQYPQAALNEGIRAIIGLPFEVLGSVRMVLRIYFDHPVYPDPEDFEFLKSLASQGAIAIRSSLRQKLYLDTFQTVSASIHSGHSVQDILDTIVRQITEIFSARGCIFWMLDTTLNKIVHRVTSGFPYRSLLEVDYETVFHLFSPEQSEITIIEDARNDPRIQSLERLGKRMVVTIVGVPVMITQSYVGILAVYFGRRRHLVSGEIQFLKSLAEQGAIALHKALHYDEKMLETFTQTIEGLVLALEAKDISTHGHSQKVADYARWTAESMALPTHLVEAIYKAGLLHDIGKIGMQNQILDKLGKLTSREAEIIRKHPIIGARILAPFSFLSEVIPLIRYHHERYDGSGYPEGIAGDTIPLGARILHVCDSFETMISGRLKIKPIDFDSAIDQLRLYSGRWYDPGVIDAFMTVAEKYRQSLRPLNLNVNYFEKYQDELTTCQPELKREQPWQFNFTVGI